MTAGNSSGINDGAPAVVLMTREKAINLGLQPVLAIKGYAVAGVEPEIMGFGPAPAKPIIFLRKNLKNLFSYEGVLIYV